jgi:ABC-2 type transport system permease protein
MPIFDQGYQHWSGELSGLAWRWLAITRHGYRIGMKNNFMRIVLLLAWLPAIGLAFFLSIWGLIEQRSPLVQVLLSYLTFLGPEILADPKTYRVEVWTLCYDYFLDIEMRFSMILILIVGPSLISQDIRFNALPLYFSRPLRRIDYFLGKLGVIGAFLGMVLVVPSIVGYILGLMFSLDITIVADTFRLLIASVTYGAIMTLSAGMLILALSCLSRNSRYIGLFWVGVWFITSIVGTILEDVNRNNKRSAKHQRMAEQRSLQANRGKQMTLQEQQRQRDAEKNSSNEALEQELADTKSDWRPMVSYTGNLNRIGVALLGTNSCWEKLSLSKPEEDRVRYRLDNMGPQYPWQWSAGVLFVLFGISACILNFRVKSLDRLK